MMDKFKFDVFMVVLIIIQIGAIIAVVETYYNENNLIDEWETMERDRGGFYDGGREVIVVFTQHNDIDYIQFALMHEMCHKIWWDYLSDEERDEYKRISKDATEWIREYAKKNVREDFADHCGFWIMGSKDISDEREIFLLNNVDKYITRLGREIVKHEITIAEDGTRIIPPND